MGRWNGKGSEKLETGSAVRKPWCQMRESNQPDEEVQSGVHPVPTCVQILRMMGDPDTRTILKGNRIPKYQHKDFP